MAAKIYLPVVEDLTDAAFVTAPQMPLMIGNESENLACGKCKTVVFRNVSTFTVAQRLASSSGKLLLKCTCGAHLLLPSDGSQINR